MVKKKRKGTTNLELEGKRFGKLVVLREMDERVHGNIMWECLCDCGVKTTVRGNSLTSGNTNSCGCLKSTVRKGNKYGKLTTVRREKEDGKWKWLCNCDCGNETWVLSGNLIQNNTRSCGCLKPINEELTDEERVRMKQVLATDSNITYSTWKRHVNRRDNHTCIVCGYEHTTNNDIVAHHMNSYSNNEDDRFNVDNGVTLCGDNAPNSCHREFHKQYAGNEVTRSNFEKFFKEQTGTDFAQREFIREDIMKYK